MENHRNWNWGNQGMPVYSFQYGQNSRFYHESYWVFLPSSKNTPIISDVSSQFRYIKTMYLNELLNKFCKNQIT